MEDVEEIDLKEILLAFWNRKIQIILIILACILIGIVYEIKFITPEYTASTTLVLATSENATTTGNTITTTDITLNSKLISTYSELIKSKNVLRTVIKNLNMDIQEEKLKNSITVTAVSNTELIKISVTNENADNAALIANEIANVFSAKVAEIYNINNVHVADNAEVNKTPSNINHTKNFILFAGIGIVISVIYVVIKSLLDNTVKSPEDIEKQFKVPVLITIPKYNFESQKGGKKK